MQHVICLECGHTMPPDVMTRGCDNCGSAWVEARYDLDAVRQQWPAVVQPREHTLWRYQELLPVEPLHDDIPMGEGYTPLTRLAAYERQFSHPMIFTKDERAQPTNSFKDRQAALTVQALKQHGITECALASTGNAAVAYAAYCARAGIKLWLFLTSLVPPEKMREAALYGAEVVKVSGTYDETKKVAAEFAREKGIHLDRGAKAIPGKEAMKTMAFEIAEQLALKLHPDEPHRWAAPDWYLQAVSGGIGPLGVWKGFSELLQMGLIDKMPKLGIVQAAGCAPMVQAFNAGHATAEPVVPRTLITVLATGDPGHGYVLLREAALSNGGQMVAIEDGETFRAMRHAASRAGISVEPATAVAFAGLEKMLREGMIARDEIVVLNVSGHTFPAESHILGDQYEQYILDLDVKSGEGPREEGLGSALQNLDEQVTTIVVVDDNPNDRRLVRRLLQSYKRYRVYEARDGAEALDVIRERKPDFVVIDLTMPGMSGFELLDHLKSDELTAHIPVMVVSGKSLTAQDRAQLEAHAASFWLKAGMDTRALVDHVVKTLGHEPIGVIQPENRPVAPLEDQAPAPDGRATDHTVVVIDDNARDARLARKMLESAGDIAVIEAATGRDGLKAVYNYHPDLVVLDLLLPDMDGLNIVETLAKEPHLRDIPIIVYTARDLSENERDDLRARVGRVVEKASLDRGSFVEAVKLTLS